MPARLNRRHTADIITKIKTAELLRRLQAFALDTPLKGADGTAEAVVPKFTAKKLKATLWLLERTLARAEAPKNLNITGHLTLEDLIAQSRTIDTDDDSVSRPH